MPAPSIMNFAQFQTFVDGSDSIETQLLSNVDRIHINNFEIDIEDDDDGFVCQFDLEVIL